MDGGDSEKKKMVRSFVKILWRGRCGGDSAEDSLL